MKVNSNIFKIPKHDNGALMRRQYDRWLNRENTLDNAKNTDYWDDYYKNDDIDADILSSGMSSNWTLELLNDERLYNPDLFKSKKLNATGYNNWNEAFNALLGLNSTYFDYDKGRENWLGPSTWNRHLVLSRLQERNKKGGSTFLTIAGGKRVQFNITTGRWEEIPTEDSTTESTPSITKKDSTTVEETTKTEKEDTPTLYDYPLNADKYKEPGFSDWIPLSHQRANEKLANLRSLKLEAEKKFPLKEAPYLNYKVTNDYFGRSLLNQLANLTRAYGAMNLGSSAEENLNILKNAEELALKLDLQAQKLRSDTYYRETGKAQEVANANIKAGVDVANYNRAANTAAFNNILDAKQKFIAKDLASRNSFISNLTTSYGEYLKTKRLNELAYNNGMIGLKSENEINSLVKNYEKLSQSPELSPVMSAYINKILSGADAELTKALNLPPGTTWESLVKNNPEKANLVRLRLLSGTDNVSTLARADFLRWLESQGQTLSTKIDNIRQSARYLMLQSPQFVTNQWGPNIDFAVRPSPLFRKSGGTVDKLSNYLKLVQDELKDVKKNSHKRNELVYKNLDKELDRLNKELLLLLRSIFK